MADPSTEQTSDEPTQSAAAPAPPEPSNEPGFVEEWFGASAGEPTAEPQNKWVDVVQKSKAGYDHWGTAALQSADAHGEKANAAMAEQSDEAARAAKDGRWGRAIAAGVSGAAQYVAHKTVQVAGTGVAIQAATASGICDVLRGEKRAVTKVAVGAGVAAAAPAVLGAGSGAALATGVVTGVGDGLAGYGVAQGSGQIARARNGKEAALGVAQVGLAAAAPQMAKGAGAFLENAAEASGVSEALEGAATKFWADSAVESEGMISEHLAEGFGRAVRVIVPEAGGEVVAQSVEHAADRALERRLGDEKEESK